MNRFTSRQVVVLCAISMSVGAVLSPPSSSLAQPSPSSGSQQGPLIETPQPLATPPVSSGPFSSARATTRAIGTITGEGTTGNITRFTGANAIGNSALFENNGRIGLGTSSPVGLFSAYSGDTISLYGYHSAASGDQPGVQGDTVSTSTNAAGVTGSVKVSSPGVNAAGVRGANYATNSSGFGIFGSHAGGGSGIYGASYTGNGVLGDSTSGIGVRGRHTLTTGTSPGVNGETNSTDANAIGVQGIVNSTSPGSGSAGVRGINNSTDGGSYGVYGSQNGSGTGVYGTSPTGTGVYGKSPSGIGVYGNSTNDYGVYGTSSTNNGVYGYSSTNNGVSGLSSSGNGVSGISNSNNGVYGYSANGYAGYFNGNVHITGTLSKGAGSFKIDHPLHPATEYLSHSFVESPDMKNIYDGNVTLNSKGEAIVELPDYFQALNREFRYQLTCIGAPANLYIAQKISGNHFKIAGGKADMEVSWQVTGTRNDAYAREHRIRVEETKTGADRGKYLFPAGFGAGPDKQIGPNKPRLAKR